MKNTTSNAYQTLLNLSKEISLLRASEALLSWDQETYMPAGGSDARADQISLINALIHKIEKSNEFEKSLSSLIDLDTGSFLNQSLTNDQKACLINWKRDYLIASKLPEEHVKKESKLTSKAQHIWAKARKEKDFSQFAPILEQIVDLNREKSTLLGSKEHPYDALLDLFEPEITTKDVDTLFSNLQTHLVKLVQKTQQGSEVRRDFLEKDYPIDSQKKTSQAILEAFQLSPQNLRLDSSTHPFSTSLHPTDCRITTRYHINKPLDSISATIHEAGHAMYELDLDPSTYGSPLSKAVSYGIHESQSRFWETCIGNSLPFCEFLFPIMQKNFPSQLKNITVDQFYKALNKVTPSFIRIEADEITYCLHIILRFQIEKALIEGSLSVKDLPEAWNAKMSEFLNITPPSDDLGVLQDIHWALGCFGYFPAYALGNIYAGQQFMSFQEEFPNWANDVKEGNFSNVKKWLKEKIHIHGMRYFPKELMLKATNKPISEQDYLHYLSQKVDSIY